MKHFNLTSNCHKLKFSNPYIFAMPDTHISYLNYLIYNLINSLKYPGLKLGCKDIGIRISGFVGQTCNSFTLHWFN